MRLLLLLLLSFEAFAAPPVISCTPSRISGTAPLGVTFDCSGTTITGTTKPFHDGLYWTTFGDPSAGTWTTGANANVASKNFATGPIVAHVFETPGTYTVTHRVSDGTATSSTTNTITVADPNTTYSAANTKCFYDTSASGDCPNGGAETLNADFDNALGGCHATGKRCLFQRGSTFTASTCTGLAVAGPTTVGAYGTGAKPIVNGPSANCILNFATTNPNDTRIMDLDLRGDGTAHASEYAIGNTAATSGATILRVDVSETGGTAITFQNRCTGCIIQDSTVTGNHLSAQVYLDLLGSAVLGNSFGPVGSGGEHSLRIARWQKSVIAHNLVTTSAVNKEVVTLRALVHVTTDEDSFDGVFSDNEVVQGTAAAQLVTIKPTSGAEDGRIYDVIVERNWILMGAYAGGGNCHAVIVSGVRVTVRNNLMDMSAPTSCTLYGMHIVDNGAEPSPDDVASLNNTMYSSSTLTFIGNNVAASAANSVIKNNLCWADVGGVGTVCVADAGTGTSSATNSTTGQTTGTDPLFDTPLSTPAGFRIGTGSYAATGGTAIFPASNSDFFNCDDNTANERLGAFVPRTRARCKGSAGP